MKQIVQNYKTGILAIEEMPEPVVQPGGVLVQTYHSLISAGTEKTKIDDSKNLFLAWPGLVLINVNRFCKL